MDFLTEQDIKGRLLTKFYDEIVASNPTLQEDIEAETIEIFKSYLNDRFDVDDIFSKTGDERSSILVKYLADVVVYEMLSTNPTRKIADNYEKRYERAMKWLMDCKNGDNVPVNFTLQNLGSRLRFGSSSNQSYYF